MYDPQNSTDRKILAQAILDLMARSLFVEVFREGTKERVFAREVPESNGKVRLLVYTSIEGDAVRECGEDAIRACAVYTARDGQERGIASAEKRVHRVGEISAVTDRLIERMREVWRLIKTAEKCPKCSAPMFKAKSGKLCCADLCFLSRGRNSGYHQSPVMQGLGRFYASDGAGHQYGKSILEAGVQDAWDSVPAPFRHDRFDARGGRYEWRTK